VTDDLPDMSLAGAVTLDDIRAAADRIRGRAHRTPIHTSRTLDERSGCGVLLKCENFQRVGAFKFRGAFNALARTREGTGVLTYSSGNHAQAMALAAAELGRRAVIVMPDNAPAIKRAATRGYLERAAAGSRVETYDPQTQTREELGRGIAEAEGLTVIPPYDHPDVIAGQGTAALELFEDAGGLDALFVPCGGGGLLSGSAVAARGLHPACRVIGVEPEVADDATRSFRTGRLHRVRNPPTIADGTRTPCLGRYTFPLVLTHVSAMVTVSERQIAEATIFAWERLKLVVEPSGALGIAALLAGHEAAGERVGVIVSGGNVDPGLIPEVRALAGPADSLA
jgi:threonine dehydratase